MGSNMAEQHPVGFQWVIEAKERGAKVIHVDPRFTRTSAMADLHVPIRAGTDIAFLGGIVHHILERDAWFREYVEHYTNGPVIITPDFEDTEDASGLFSGWDPGERAYGIDTWGYNGAGGETTAGTSMQTADVSGDQAHGAHGMKLTGGDPPDLDNSMQDERCVLQVLKRHFARYTPEAVAEICGCAPTDVVKVAQAMCENSGRERTSSVVYSVGWTQHTVGVQNIRAASIVQLLLGNIGRPGGGILALRGHANIQGSTDIPTLFDILPGYIPMPHPGSHPTLDRFVELNGPDTGVWGDLRPYIVSLLKAWWGDAATKENEFCFPYLPRINGDHSHYAMMLKMLDGGVQGMFCVGQNPAVGSANSKLMRAALAKLDWLVVRDFQPTESALFWKDSPEHESGEARAQDIATEVFFLPAANHTEKDGCFTNTQRLLQWHHKACEPPGDARSELHWIYHLGRAIRAKLADSQDPTDRPVLDLTWEYPRPRSRRRARRRARPSGDLRTRGRRIVPGQLRRTSGRRHDGVGLVDPLRHLQGRRQPGGAPQAAHRPELDRPRVGMGVAQGRADHLQPRVRRSRRQAVVGAQALRLVGRGGADVDGSRRRAGLPADQAT